MSTATTIQGYRISPEQSRLWLLQQQSSAYLALAAIEIEGPVDVARLEAALAGIVNRLEILRTTFRLQTGMRTPLQVITDLEKVSCQRIDWSGYSRSQVDAALDALLAEQRKRPVNLDTGPVLELWLASVSAHEHYLILRLPSLCADSASLNNLFEEVVSAYGGDQSQDQSEELLQYADFAEWHYGLLDEDEQSAAKAYWREQRLNSSSLSTIRRVRKGASPRAFDVAITTLALDRETASAAEVLARDKNIPVSDVYLACWQTLVWRLCGEPDVAIGAVADDRGHETLRNACGLYSITLPVRHRFHDRMRFDEVVDGIAKSRRVASDRQYEFSWERNVEGSGSNREPGFFPLAFQFQARPLRRNVGAASFSVVRSFACTDRFHIKLNCVQDGGAISLEWHFDPNALSTEEIERLSRHYQAIVKSAVENPRAAALDLEVLDDAQRQELVVLFNDSVAQYSIDACVHERFEEVARRDPDRPAVVYEQQVLSYGELNARSNQLAHRLRSLGVGPDARVGLCVERSPDIILGILGIIKAGGAYVPLDHSLPSSRLTLLIEDSRASLVVCQQHLTELFSESQARCVVLNDDPSSGISRESKENCSSGVTPANLVYTLFTSGSTGTPKGVLIEHRQLVNYVDGVRQRLQLSEDVSFATVSSYAADLGNTAIFPALLSGGCLHIVAQDRVMDPAAMAEYGERHGIDCLKIVPSHLAALLSAPRAERVLPRRRLVLGGEASTWDLVNRVEALSPDCQIMNHYGPTETTVGVLTYRHERGHQRADDSDTLPLGRPIGNSQVYLLDSRSRPVPIGVSGELHIGGAGLARGYVNRPEQTAAAFVPNPFSPEPGARMYRTGDLASYLVDGNVEFLGRADHQVKIRGFRIELGEIESVLAQHPSIEAAVVLAREDAPGDKRLNGYVVRRRDAQVTAEQLRDYARGRLPEYMVPSAIAFLDRLPLNRNGKVDRGALPAIALATDTRDSAGVPPRTANEEKLIAIWSEVLGNRSLGIHDDFFECGGHSLLAMQLIVRVREAFDVELPLPALFDTPTVAGLARSIESLIGAAGSGAPSSMKRVSRDGRLPLSFAQQRLWFLDQLEPHSSAYNRSFAVRLTGPLNPESLEQSLREVIRRHEVLRTTYPTVDGEAHQIINPTSASTVRVIDLVHLPLQARDDVANRLVTEDAHRPFDLAGGPLVRASLLRLDDALHVLVLSQHHINTDAWSNGVFAREVSAGYEAFSRGLPSPLAELSIQYADFATWQREWLAGGTIDEQLSFWKEELKDVPSSLDLPTDRPRPAVPRFRGATQTFALSRSLSESLKELSQQESATLFMTLLAAFQALLYRYAGQLDIVVGTPIAGRMRPEVQDLIGFFVNTLVLRADMRGEPTFRDLLRQIRRRSLAAFANQDLPFETLVDELELKRDLRRTPLFQVMFVLQTNALESLCLPGIGVTQLPTPIENAKFELTLFMTETEQGLNGLLEYDADLFDATTIDRMLANFEVLLHALVADPERPVWALPLLSRTERQRLLVEFNDTRANHPEGECLHELIEAQVRRTPDAVAVAFDDQQLTYGALNQTANQLARYLRSLGVKPEARVGVCVERSVEMVVAVLGILKAGAAYVPMDPAYPADRLAYILRDSRATVLLTDERLPASLLPDHSARVIGLNSVLRTAGGGSVENLGRIAGAQNLSHVIYTSGSTGQPKGVAIEQRSVVTLVHWSREHYAPEDLAGVLASTSICFDLSVWELFVTLSVGGTVILAPTALELPALPAAQRVTLINTVPSVIGELLRTGGIPSSVRTVNLAGEPLTSDLSDALYGVPTITNVCDLYGPSEDTTYSTFARREMGGPATIGRPLANTRVYLGEAGREPVPIGVRGELYLGGSGLARGYLDRPDLTAERFLPDALGGGPGERVYRTGDSARWRVDGSLDFLGRIDHQVKIRGFRIEPGEVEAALRQHPAVREAIVLAREDQPGARRLVAYLTVVDSSATSSDLRTHLRDRLPAYMVPAAFVMLDTLPLLPNGKVDRRALPAPDQIRPELEEAFVAPRGPIEQRLAEIWCGVLGLERVGVHDSFFDLGGDSILSIQIVSRANQAGLLLSPRQIFEHQTIAELALAAGTAPAVEATQGLVTGSAPLTAIQEWFFDQRFVDPHHFNQSVLLETRVPVNREWLERAVDALLVQHDALRLRFVRDDRGWQQEDTAASSPTTFSTIDLSGLGAAEQRAELDASTARVQASLSLDRGPQLRVVLFDLGEQGQRVLLVVHHLVVDGVSWRILLEDLQTAYDQVSRGDAIQLPPKTTAFAEWARRCHEFAGSDALQGEMSYWLSERQSTVGRLPVDEPHGINTVASARSVMVALSAAETEALLREVPDVYHTQINDVLLTAVSQAFAGWTGETSVLIDLEGHGREELFADVDVSRTVGWFTSMYPLVLQREPGAGPGESLKSIKEQLRHVPGRGIGYGLLRYRRDESAARLAELPKAEVTFNYLGQFDRALPETSRFTWAKESSGPTQSPQATRSHLLDVNGLISEGCLRLSIKFSENLHRRQTIERLADGILVSLRSLIRHCQSTEAGGYTPSDFPLTELDQKELDRVVGADRSIEDVYPLSPLQQGLLFHTLLDAASGVYLEQFCCTVHGELDVARFRSAWQRTVDRHPTLRTSFRHVGLRQPLQIVHRQIEIEFVHRDWRELSPEVRGRELDSFLERDRERGFDLANPPLMRLAVLQIAPDTCQVVWTYHHLLLDGWSVPIVLNDVLAGYESAPDSERVRRLPPRPYRDFIQWHRLQDLAAAEQFWRRALDGFAAPTPLTVDVSQALHPEQPSPHEESEIQLSQASTDALKSFGRQHQLTLNTLVQAAWGLLLNRYSGQDDVLFGATVSGRQAPLPGVESMVGLFINTVPVRVRVRRGESLVAWLQTLQGEQLATREFEYCALGKVQSWSQLPAGTPMFESLLVFENYPVDQALLKRQQGLRIDRSRTIERTNYPLTLVAAPGQRLSLRLNYDAHRFDSTTVARMLGHLEAVLEGMIGDGDRRVDDIQMLTRTERQQLLVEWNDTRAAHAGPNCVHRMFEEQAARSPDAIALVFEGQCWSYSALDRWANQLAVRLTALGVGPDVLVGLFMERSPEMVAGILGVLKAGGAYVPLPRDYPTERLQFMLDDCGAKLLLTQDHLRTELPAGPVTVEYVGRDGLHEGTTAPRAHVTEQHLAYVIYTSGSTGLPKGTMIEHRSAVNYLAWCTQAYPVADGCGAPVQSSIGFDATITSLISPLVTGRAVVLLPESQEIEALGVALSSHSDFGLVKLTPAHLKMLVSMVPEARAQGGTRSFVIGGEALTAEDVEFWRVHAPRTRLINEYGPTETVVGCCVYTVSDDTPRSGPVSIGRPIDNTELYVLGPHVDPKPVRVPGELFIGGAGLSRGYINRPELTADRFVPNPFGQVPGTRLYRTGDLVRHGTDGNLDYLGRIDHQVKLRGFRIELGEIESVLRGHPNVSDAVVLARDDQGRGKRLVAYLTTDAQTRPTILDLRGYLQGKLPGHMVPSIFVMLDALPLTANGKVDRRALPAPDGSRQELETAFVPGRTDAEQKIAAVWKEVIGVDRVGIDDNFFEAGGDSLRMIEVQWKLQDVFNRDIPLAQLFQNPTVRSLAAGLSQPLENVDVAKKSQTRAQARLAAVKGRARRPENT